MLILIGFILYFILRQSTTGDDTIYKSQIKSQQKIIDDLSVRQKETKSRYDSVLKKLDEVEKGLADIDAQETKIIHKYESIPAIVRNYSRDGLRKAFTSTD